MLRRDQHDGEFGDFETRTMARAIRSAIDGAGQQRTLDPDLDFNVVIWEPAGSSDRATRALAPHDAA